MSTKKKTSPESIVREIKRKTRRKFTAEEKIRIILEGLRAEVRHLSVAELIRRAVDILIKSGIFVELGEE